MRKLIRKTSDWVNMMPLIGKLVYRPMLFDLYVETSYVKKVFKSVGICLLFVLTVFMHWLQADLGWDGFETNTWIVWKAFSLVYVLVNYLVCYTQTVLFFRIIAHAWRFFFKRKDFSGSIKHEPRKLSRAYIFASISLTLLGQALMLYVIL